MMLGSCSADSSPLFDVSNVIVRFDEPPSSGSLTMIADKSTSLRVSSTTRRSVGIEPMFSGSSLVGAIIIFTEPRKAAVALPEPELPLSAILNNRMSAVDSIGPDSLFR